MWHRGLCFCTFQNLLLIDDVYIQDNLYWGIQMLNGKEEPKQKKGWSESLLEFRSGFGEKMKVVSKKRWKSLGPLHLKSKSVARFCFFSKLKSNNHGPGRAPVYLNVYDLTPINGYIYWAGLGIFHSGVEGKL